MSNSATLVDRELAHGGVEGVHFGPSLWCIARSPRAVLCWVFGHSWSVNGNQRYAEPHLLLLPQRERRGNLIYKCHRPAWTRLTPARVEEFPLIGEAFGPESIPLIKQAIKARKTLLIEGGGGRLMPDRSKGEAAYQAWRAQPNRGLYNGPEKIPTSRAT